MVGAQSGQNVPNEAGGDNLAYAAEKLLRESGDKLPSHVKLDLENQAQALRKALESNDADAIKSAAGEVEAAMQRAGQAVYAQQPEAGQAAGAASSDGSATGAGTVEGEFREV